MRKLKVLFVFIGALSISLAPAQTFQKMTIEEMFELADANSRSIRMFRLAEEEAGQAVKVARNAQLPSIDVSVSTSYLGDAWLADSDFTNGENAAMPHFGNNFALEAQQVIYAGGAINSSITLAELGQQMAALDWQKNRQEIRFLLTGYYLVIQFI